MTTSAREIGDGAQLISMSTPWPLQFPLICCWTEGSLGRLPSVDGRLTRSSQAIARVRIKLPRPMMAPTPCQSGRPSQVRALRAALGADGAAPSAEPDGALADSSDSGMPLSMATRTGA
jgi:hypothetical protein